METLNVININSSASLRVQMDSDGNPFIARLCIKGMPLQPRDNMGGLFPNLGSVIKGLMSYGFIINEDDERFDDPDFNEKGLLGPAILNDLKKIFKK